MMNSGLHFLIMSHLIYHMDVMMVSDDDIVDIRRMIERYFGESNWDLLGMFCCVISYCNFWWYF